MSVSLSVREITSVSVTFSLVCDEPSVLAGGISVTVNSAAWPRAFVRIDEQMDEAVIIIYALMPGRQYDVELALEGGILKSTVSTDDDDGAFFLCKSLYARYPSDDLLQILRQSLRHPQTTKKSRRSRRPSKINLNHYVRRLRRSNPNEKRCWSRSKRHGGTCKSLKAR